MSHADARRYEGLARKSAREAVEREAAQRELQEKLHRIEILRNFSQKQFSRLNRSIIGAAVWLIVFAIAFGVVGWYSADIMKWVFGLAG